MLVRSVFIAAATRVAAIAERSIASSIWSRLPRADRVAVEIARDRADRDAGAFGDVDDGRRPLGACVMRRRPSQRALEHHGGVDVEARQLDLAPGRRRW